MKKIILLIGVLLIIGCQPQTQNQQIEGFVPDRTIEIDAFSFGYEPDSIRLTEGEKIRLIVTNNENIRHTFTVPKLNIDVNLRANSVEEIDFIAPMTGDIEFFCTVFGHRPAGMEGNIHIE